MATILQFQPVRKPATAVSGGLTAKVIIFPGVRYERRESTSAPRSASAPSTQGKLPH